MKQITEPTVQALGGFGDALKRLCCVVSGPWVVVVAVYANWLFTLGKEFFLIFFFLKTEFPCVAFAVLEFTL